MTFALAPHPARAVALALATVLGVLTLPLLARQDPPQFGGAYARLEPQRQRLVDDWVARFSKTTGQAIPAQAFYDDILGLSIKTTFDAVTHALMTTTLTDTGGGDLGNVLALVAQVNTVRGEVRGEAGDRQFRIYVQLTASAYDTLMRSREFRRGVDNSVFHKGYPINFRQQGGVPSIQVSMSTDRRAANIDVDYRSSKFPVAMFNGHLASANSDVRAGNNADRHVTRWTGLQDWWRAFFGFRGPSPTATAAEDRSLLLPRTPRLARATIEASVSDFLQAWLTEGNAMAAMGYVSDRAHACLARGLDDPSAFDRGMAPFQMLMTLRSTHEALRAAGTATAPTVGVRLPQPALRVVSQPHHARFVLYEVPDDVAAEFECDSRLAAATTSPPRRVYGRYFGAMFYIAGQKAHPLALLWTRERGTWKLVAWRGAEDGPVRDTTPPPTDATSPLPAAPAPADLARTATRFLEDWFIARRADRAVQALSPRAYACYDLLREQSDSQATSPAEAARRLEESMTRASELAGTPRTLEDLMAPAPPVHPSVRLLQHARAEAFALMSVPDAFATYGDCAFRASGQPVPADFPLVYGATFGMNFRLRLSGGEGPVLRMVWTRDAGRWRIVAYDLETP